MAEKTRTGRRRGRPRKVVEPVESNISSEKVEKKDVPKNTVKTVVEKLKLVAEESVEKPRQVVEKSADKPVEKSKFVEEPVVKPKQVVEKPVVKEAPKQVEEYLAKCRACKHRFISVVDVNRELCPQFGHDGISEA